MADSISRIVPPSVALDRTGQLSQERRRKAGGDVARHQDADDGNKMPASQQEKPAVEDNGAEENKGKHLDINA
ncbi:MAG TPA: hypothetical protein VMT22_19290 [Terriglobales bacterium]|nr:hypothetical protein [Terriglobales bacterium]